MPFIFKRNQFASILHPRILTATSSCELVQKLKMNLYAICPLTLVGTRTRPATRYFFRYPTRFSFRNHRVVGNQKHRVSGRHNLRSFLTANSINNYLAIGAPSLSSGAHIATLPEAGHLGQVSFQIIP